MHALLKNSMNNGQKEPQANPMGLVTCHRFPENIQVGVLPLWIPRKLEKQSFKKSNANRFKELENKFKGGGNQGCLGGSAIERLPSAQGVIPEFQDRIPHQAPCTEPASTSVNVSASLCVCLS